jgi:hypothetical protein
MQWAAKCERRSKLNQFADTEIDLREDCIKFECKLGLITSTIKRALRSEAGMDLEEKLFT